MDYLKAMECRLHKEINRYLGKKTFKSVMKKEFTYGLCENNEHVVVSMASYAGRYNTIMPTLKSLLVQSYKPDKIIVWLDKEIPENIITDQMKEFEKYGVEYRYTDDDLMPHKKYFYAMREFKDSIIITVDDDLVYSSELIESLINTYKKYPNCVCARRVHKMKFDQNRNILPYKTWEYEYKKERTPSYLLCPTGCGGVLYPAGVLPEETFEIEKIKRLCLRADDIWLKIMELKNRIKVVWVKCKYVMPLEVYGSQESSLNATNVIMKKNDLFLEKLIEKYPEVLAIMKKN